MSFPEQPHKNACLFLDVDGTLVEIAASPDAIVVTDALLSDLESAEDFFGGALALVSGRSIADLDRLFAPKVMVASGVHGAEIRVPGRSAETWTRAAPLPDAVRRDLSTLLHDFPGTLAEDKVFSYAVHYRAVPESGPTLRDALREFVSARSDLGLQILPGHCVFELKRPGIDKGGAIGALMEQAPFAGRIPIFVGDDVTDAPGFAKVKSLGGRAYSVGKAFTGVDGVFEAPSDVRTWLARIGRQGTRAA